MEKKKSIILTIVAVATLIALVVGATYAYFQATGGQAANADVKVTTYTTDLLTFTTGDPIAIYADQSNFAYGLGNQSGETFARAHLLANNKTNTATDNYYVYLNVTNNTFEYTQEDRTAELLLQVTDPNGVEVTTLSGLEYKTITDGKGVEVKGFDVTTFKGLAIIANNYEINANPETTQTWNVSIVFVNLDADQTKNTGKSLLAELMIQKEVIQRYISDVCDTNSRLGTCIKNLGDRGKSDFTNLYYHDSTLENGAGDYSYRYAGSSDTTNNFVCFGSGTATCPDDNLYRIIGVFNGKVKLIKWDYATIGLLGNTGGYKGTDKSKSWGSKGTNIQTEVGTYWWNNDGTDDGTNTWSASKLNTSNLNNFFLTNIGATWANKISTTTWKVGGNTYQNIYQTTATNAYKNEYKSPVESTTYSAKVGLMYVSDYGFAATPSAWTTNLNTYRSYINDNWMYMGLAEWTIMRRSDSTCGVFCVYNDGSIGDIYAGNSLFAYPVRIVFYLNSSVNYVSGSGTKTNPIIIN